MTALRIPRLQSGGLIVTYRCTSRCRHCLYASSPRREARYIGGEAARRAFAAVKDRGCASLHIGGGEPFLDPEGLLAVARAARAEDVGIEYVETNSSWYREGESAVALLHRLQDEGVTTLLLSISPFHTEYVPFCRVRGVIEACRKAGTSVFPWVESFLPDVTKQDESTTHTIEEIGGSEYLPTLPSRYWINMGGRAVLSFGEVLPLTPVEELPGAGAGCAELSDTSHFHVDLDGSYVPGLCSGLVVPLEDVGKPLDPGRLPVLSVLWEKGPAALMEAARGMHGFQPRPSYLNKCHLCLDLRRFLARLPGSAFPDLAPAGFYEELTPA